MQKQNVGRKYGPLTATVSGQTAREIAEILGVERESVTRNNEIPAGIVTAAVARELFAEMFDDLTDDGVGDSSRRLALGTEYYYDGVLEADKDYVLTGEILSVEERQTRTGRYQFGTLETRYAEASSLASVLRVHTIFAERQGPPVQREKSDGVTETPPPAKPTEAWRPPTYTNQSILDYVLKINDRNQNHRDDDFARKNGFPSRIAAGGMATFLLADYVSRLCRTQNVASIAFRLSQPIYPGQALEITGHAIRSDDPSKHQFSAILTADGRTGATATATLRRPFAG